MKTGVCAYCGQTRELTREHFLEGTLRGEPDEVVTVFPPSGQHRHGGQLILEDVCADCNNVRLGQLDEFVGQWLRENPDAASSPDSAAILLRWLGKKVWNGHRADPRPEPWLHAPPSALPRWVIGDLAENPGFRAVVSWIPKEFDAAQGTSYGRPGGPSVSDAEFHWGPWLFGICWRRPSDGIGLDQREQAIADFYPATPIREGAKLDQKIIKRMKNPHAWIVESMRAGPIWSDLLEGLRRKEAAKGHRGR